VSEWRGEGCAQLGLGGGKGLASVALLYV
jgi:hypothetical protein